MALGNVSVSEIPEEDRGCTHQICRVSLNVAEHSHLSLGQCVRIKTPQKTVICRVFPWKVSNACIQYDTCVTEPCDLAEQSGQQKVDIHPLDCRDGKEISVKLVVKDICQYKNFQSLSHVQTELVQKSLRCLHGIYVSPGCIVDLTFSKLAKLYGLHLCLVQECYSESGQIDSCSAIRVTQKTAVRISGVQSWECYELLKQTASGMKEVIVSGLQQEREQLTDLLKLPKHLSCSQGVLLRGPPGCGKTSLVQQVAFDCKAALLAVNGAEVLSSNPGESESNLAALFDKAVRVSREAPCILFIDEADSICPKRGKSSSTNISRLTTALLTQLDKVAKVCGLLVVMATNRPSALDPDIRRPGRLDKEILMSVPTTSQRREIFSLHLRRLPLAADLDLDKLSFVTPGYVGADIEAVCIEAQRKAFHRTLSYAKTSPVLSTENSVTQADMEAAILSFRPSMQRGVDSVVDVRKVLWSDIGGLDNIKLQIQQAIEWPMLYPETFQALGLPLTKGVLLYGPPGCGKTTLVQAAATACHVTFLSLSCAQLYSPYVGDSEKKVSETFQKARALAPSILFLDEVDSIVGKRSESTSGSGVSERVLSALLNEMDGIGIRLDDKTDSREMEAAGDGFKYQTEHRRTTIQEAHDRHVLVVAATNRPDMLDAALLRPGRMDRLIYVPPPDAQGRLQSFRIHTRKMPLAEDVDLCLLAEQTLGYTGADIRGVCKEAGLLALRESMAAECVHQAHFVAALKDCKPSLPSDPSQVEALYKRIQKSCLKK
ncbi:ATPase family gene 2 protein homolog B-like isoform X2 [Babylonia areolata]|uniref:ATPase family gene 2 protein homolog B-like isoform X2 n=1 Tax=Babylonia areolata TaxID=304850 RepID=UPI003FD38F11